MTSVAPTIVVNNASSTEIKLGYYENTYPDEGDFTLLYNLTRHKQEFQHRLDINFWHKLGDILDETIYNVEIKKEWNDLRVNGYCLSNQCCDGCCKDCSSARCCNGCFTINCCRFCCCNGECHCCHGNCKSCLSLRDYYIGAIFLVIIGIFTIYQYPSITCNPLAVLMIIIGSIMLENYRINGELKHEWREKVINILSQNLGTLSGQYNVQFSMTRQGFFGILLKIEFLSQSQQQQQQQTVMLVVQPQQQQNQQQVQQIQQVQQPQYIQQPQQVQYIQQQQPIQDAKQTEGGITYK